MIQAWKRSGGEDGSGLAEDMSKGLLKNESTVYRESKGGYNRVWENQNIYLYVSRHVYILRERIEF